MDPLDTAYLDTPELAERWGVSARTLEGWRRRRNGPAFVRFGRLVRHPLENIRSYEAERLHASTASVAGTSGPAHRASLARAQSHRTRRDEA